MLCLTALGVVYGDIGTSPLYAMRECFHGPHAVAVTHDNVLGVLSLITWALIMLVTLKYHVYVLRADNKGEGGILALMALARSTPLSPRQQKAVLGLGLFGAALLYGDGMLTPAISVLSAIEGLEVATPFFAPYVVPITVAILVGLFLLQRRGTTGIGVVFGPLILVWFLFLAGLGVHSLWQGPSVLAAVNPAYALRFLLENGLHGYLVLGAVFLVATGGEALYADLGHFEERAIQLDWFAAAGPCLLVHYYGQGALLLRDPSAAHNPFYMLVPSWALYPAVALAAMATVIASQAVISGVFSLTRQAVQLGFLPRAHVVHTSQHEIGQIYIPAVNWLLLASTIALVVGFKSSSNLASAYGIAISVTMVVTTMLAHFVSTGLWGWRRGVAWAVTGTFLAVDLAFLGANSAKVLHGGWFPLAAAAAVVAIFTTWKTGQETLAALQREGALPLADFAAQTAESSVARVPGTAVFLTSTPGLTPSALLHNMKHNKVLHARNVFVTVRTEDVPRIRDAERLSVSHITGDFVQVSVRFGFMEDPDLPQVMARLAEHGLKLRPMDTTYILSDNTLVTTEARRMPLWRLRLFSFLYKNAVRPTQYFNLPINRVIEIGRQLQI
ncbi:MAG: potassium transporter Kup [Elusimicrobia bacterium]|nr:potassium transporter Kup [Elusimicrobiota bacterium]